MKMLETNQGRKVTGSMGIPLNILGGLDEKYDLCLGKSSFLYKAQEIHDLGLVMEEVNDLRVRRGGQAK